VSCLLLLSIGGFLPFSACTFRFQEPSNQIEELVSVYLGYTISLSFYG
jgi:hypothetical protein